MVGIYHDDTKVAEFVKDDKKFLIGYKNDALQKSISLSLPNTKKFYNYEYRFPPFLESFLPEGYLYEIFKNLLSKEYGYVDDYLIFELLASNIDARVEFKSDIKSLEFDVIDIDTILQDDSEDIFNTLVKTFLNKNAISGVQPKTVALLRDKEKLESKEYIIKTWGSEYPDLALNEYFCLKAVELAGVKIPSVKLSKNARFLVVEKFTFAKGKILGFEEILSLMDKNKNSKYSGSYEQVAKIINRYSTQKKESMKDYYKIVVMNYLLRNGDAHLKNFGLLFNDDFSSIWLSPAYDIVNTVVYIHKDKPALTLDGKKIWHSKQKLVEFGQKHCLLSEKEATTCYIECKDALKQSIENLEEYVVKNPDFKIGKMMIDSWKEALSEVSIKGVSDELIGSWREY